MAVDIRCWDDVLNHGTRFEYRYGVSSLLVASVEVSRGWRSVCALYVQPVGSFDIHAYEHHLRMEKGWRGALVTVSRSNFFDDPTPSTITQALGKWRDVCWPGRAFNETLFHWACIVYGKALAHEADDLWR